MRHVPDAERRARLGRRHALAPTARVSTAEDATRSVVVLHATEAASVHLSCWARVDGVSVADVDRALYDERTLVKQVAMRRTLFVFPRDLLPAAWGSASVRVAKALRARVAKDLVRHGVTDDGEAWLATAMADTLAHLDDGAERSAKELREQVPSLAGRMDMAPGKRWNANVPVAPQVLTQLGVEGHIVRARNAGHWRINRPTWTLTQTWLGSVPARLDEQDGYAQIVGRWLRAFGPGTEADLVWWLGATKGAVRTALAALGAVEVTLDAAATGWLLPDDVDPEPETDESWVALLPVLDPTVMGWKGRDFYLGAHGPALFDTNGNAGTTAWVDGRVVGCWVQDADGVVEVRLLEPVPASARRALTAEAERLTGWLEGQRVSTVYPSPAMRHDDGWTPL